MLRKASASLLAVAGFSLGTCIAQTPLNDAATHGKATFDQKCAICHATTDEKKIGPGLKGLYARGTMIDGTKVTDESVTDRIVNGKIPMPPFKDTLTADEIKQVVEYLRTL